MRDWEIYGVAVCSESYAKRIHTYIHTLRGQNLEVCKWQRGGTCSYRCDFFYLNEDIALRSI